MKSFRLGQFVFGVVGCVAIGGCALGPDYRRPLLDMPVAYPEDIGTGATSAL